ncbi:MAG TPA: hypothetical protein VK821_06805 [Dehalococcoidia bacterium]|nr:hypothetical protein [Dehalococcoidia bacterium]
MAGGDVEWGAGSGTILRRQLGPDLQLHGQATIAAQKRLHEDWLNTGYEHAVERSTEALVDAFLAGLPQQIARMRLKRP